MIISKSTLMLLLFFGVPFAIGVLLIIRSGKKGSGRPVCGQYGYDVSATVGAVSRCPECGEEFVKVGIVPPTKARNRSMLWGGVVLIIVPLLLYMLPWILSVRNLSAQLQAVRLAETQADAARQVAEAQVQAAQRAVMQADAARQAAEAQLQAAEKSFDAKVFELSEVQVEALTQEQVAAMSDLEKLVMWKAIDQQLRLDKPHSRTRVNLRHNLILLGAHLSKTEVQLRGLTQEPQAQPQANFMIVLDQDSPPQPDAALPHRFTQEEVSQMNCEQAHSAWGEVAQSIRLGSISREAEEILRANFRLLGARVREACGKAIPNRADQPAKAAEPQAPPPAAPLAAAPRIPEPLTDEQITAMTYEETYAVWGKVAQAIQTVPHDGPTDKRLRREFHLLMQHMRSLRPNPEEAAKIQHEGRWPAQDFWIGDDPQKHYVLVGQRLNAAAPPEGWKLLVIFPGGEGNQKFAAFAETIATQSVQSDFAIAMAVAPLWRRDEDRIVWPTRGLPDSLMAFPVEQFAEEIVQDVAQRISVNLRHVYAMGWSSGGPAVYATLLQEKTAYAGAFVAMSVFKPGQLPPPINAKGRPFYILHSPQDFIAMRFPESARDTLAAAGAVTNLQTHQGGHGWGGGAFSHIKDGLNWLVKTVEK